MRNILLTSAAVVLFAAAAVVTTPVVFADCHPGGTNTGGCKGAPAPVVTAPASPFGVPVSVDALLGFLAAIF